MIIFENKCVDIIIDPDRSLLLGFMALFSFSSRSFENKS